jgi:pre-mRNA-splicing factor 38B
MKEIIDEEKRNALAIGRDYALKPTSYKSSLSLKMPLGNTRKRSK